MILNKNNGVESVIITSANIWVGPSSITQQPGEHVDWDLKQEGRNVI